MVFLPNPPQWHTAKHGMYLECPYRQSFTEDMKRIVPSDERCWDPERKQWWISDSYLDEVDNLVFAHFECVTKGR